MINRLPSQILDWKIPCEVLFGIVPDMTILRPFGCLAYAANVSPKKRKFDSRSLKCVFLGYEVLHKGYLLYDLQTHKIFTSRDVKFFIDSFIFSTTVEEGQGVHLPLVEIVGDDGNTEVDADTESLDSSHGTTPLLDELPADLPVDVSDIVRLRRSTREHHQLEWMKDYVGNLQTGNSLPYSTSVTPPTFPCIISPQLSTSYVTYMFSISIVHKPSSYKEANLQPDWVKAMQDELDALESNHIWDLVPLRVGKKIIGNKWVYKLKLKENGYIERCEARLVAKGFNQEHGIAA